MIRLFTRFAVCGAVLALTSAAMPAHAAVFTYSSTCESSFLGSCSTIGLVDGATVSGSITLSSGALAPNGSLDASDLLDFTFTFGTATVDFADAKGLAFTATLNATMTGFTDFSLYATEALDPADTGAIYGNAIAIRPTNWTATLTGSCDTVDCSGGMLLGFESTIVSNSFTPGFGLANFARVADALPVPEPSSLLLLGVGAAWLGGFTMRKLCADHSTSSLTRRRSATNSR